MVWITNPFSGLYKNEYSSCNSDLEHIYQMGAQSKAQFEHLCVTHAHIHTY